MAHQNVPTVAERATAASTAVKRDAPNTLIAAIRRFAPYQVWTRSRRIAAPSRPPKRDGLLDTKTFYADIFVSSCCGGNSGERQSSVLSPLSRADAALRPYVGVIPIGMRRLRGQAMQVFSAHDVRASWSAACCRDILASAPRACTRGARRGGRSDEAARVYLACWRRGGFAVCGQRPAAPIFFRHRRGDARCRSAQGGCGGCRHGSRSQAHHPSG